MSVSKQLMFDVITASKLTRVYNTSGTGANANISVFQAEQGSIPHDCYMIGQVAVSGAYPDYAPPSSVILVKPLVEGVFKAPTGYTLVWNDRGSGGKLQCSFWRVEPPTGYVALGDVVTNSYSQPPESFSSKFACIREDLVVNGQITAESVWADHGTGATMAGSVWQVENKGVQGIGGTIVVQEGYDKPARPVYVLPTHVTAT